MRIGIQMPNTESFDLLEQRSRMIEDAGFDGIWKGHHMPSPGDPTQHGMDPLALLLIAGRATNHVELGTCIYCVPLSYPADLAQRLYTFQGFVPDRLTFGVGTGSQPLEYEEAGLDWEGRFARLDAHMAYIRAIYDTQLGERSEEPFSREAWKHRVRTHEQDVEPSLPMRVGMPRIALGAWHSEKRLRRAVDSYDAWMGSGGPGSRFGGWRKVLSEGIKKYRDLGGTRAIVATVAVNLSMPEGPIDEDDRFNLGCGPKSAAERLHLIEEMGYDDIILHFSKVDRWPGIHGGVIEADELAELRAIYPVDDRKLAPPRTDLTAS